MANETLSIPEQYLAEVIRVIRSGLKQESVSRETRKQLNKWCREEEAYLKMLEDEHG